MRLKLRDHLAPEASLRELESGLWSALGPDAEPQSYDRIARAYDALIGNRTYQRVMWGNDPSRELAFAREATASGRGPLLDAGCGSLLFTSRVHVESDRPTLLLDLSLGMLRRAMERIRAGDESVPSHLTLLQADLLETPLRSESFETVLCPGILHLFARPDVLLARLAATLQPTGRMFVSALVTDRASGARYLRAYARRGEIGCQLSLAELLEIAERATGRKFAASLCGNMASVWSLTGAEA